MLEQRIEKLISIRDKKQEELEQLKGQRENRNCYVGSSEFHQGFDIPLENSIKLLEAKIATINDVIQMSKSLSNVAFDRIGFGTTFMFTLDNGYSKTVTLVDRVIVEDGNEYITDKSPLGASVVGKTEGETFCFVTPFGVKMNGIVNQIFNKEKGSKTR